MSQFSFRSQRGASSMAVILGAVIVAVVIATAIATHGFGMHPQSMSAESNGETQESGHISK